MNDKEASNQLVGTPAFETGSKGAQNLDAENSSSLVLQASNLLPGDVLLYRPKRPNVVQRKISASTCSPYTHAAIFVGDGQIAESVAWPCLIGVRYYPLERSLKGSECVGVIRSQCVFSEDRVLQLKTFVADVVGQNKFYNLIAVARLPNESKKYFADQIEYIRENFGWINSREKFAMQSFFCSAFVVACYSVVGIVGETAQVAYPHQFFAPSDLYKDPTFGWLLGYLVPEGGSNSLR